MYKNIHLEQHQVDHYLSDEPVTHYNTSLRRITTAHGKRIPRMRFRRSCGVAIIRSDFLEKTIQTNLKDSKGSGIVFYSLSIYISLFFLRFSQNWNSDSQELNEVLRQIYMRGKRKTVNWLSSVWPPRPADFFFRMQAWVQQKWYLEWFHAIRRGSISGPDCKQS